jgi:hypothetical protein
MDTKTRQVIPFYVGNLRRDNAKVLWGNITVKYEQDVTYDPDFSEG